MRSGLLILFLVLSLQGLTQVTSQIVLGTPENEENYPMIRLTNGDFILAGNTKNSGFGNKDVFVTRTDPSGFIIWSKQYGGSGDETAVSVSQTPDGGFVIGGETFSSDPDGDAFIFKIDSLGVMQWWKNYGGTLYDITYSVLGLANGDIISAGLIETSPLDYDAFLMKTDMNGDTLWTKVIGQSGIDHAVNVIQTSDSGFIFCGKTLSVGQGSCDCWIVKTDMNGDTLWTSVVGGQGWDESMDIIEQPNGYVVCGGTNSEGNSNYDFFLMQLDLSGNLVWVKQYGGIWVEASYCVEEITGEGFIIAGYTETFSYTNSRGSDSANAWIVKTDYAGDTIWTMVYGGNLKEECFSAAVLPSGGIAFAGYTASYGDSTQTYLFITDSLGFTGCNERRTQPTVFSPSFVQGNYSFSVGGAISVSSPTSSQMITGAQRTSVCIPLSIIDAEDLELVFQNPVSGPFELRTGKSMTKVCLFSVNGQMISVETISCKTSTVITAPDAEGMYVMIIYFADGTHCVRKLVVPGKQ